MSTASHCCTVKMGTTYLSLAISIEVIIILENNYIYIDQKSQENIHAFVLLHTFLILLFL